MTMSRVIPAFVQEIQVAGHRCFEGKRWREAILYYLNGIWSDDLFIAGRPKLAIDGITLSLVSGKYSIYDNGCTPIMSLEEIDFGGCIPLPEPDQDAVEIALVRFVKDNHARNLAIIFREGVLFLSKGRNRGNLIVAASKLPTMDEWRKQNGI